MQANVLFESSYMKMTDLHYTLYRYEFTWGKIHAVICRYQETADVVSLD